MTNFIVAIVVGILAGFIASKITGGEGKGCWIDLFLGLVGGVVGKWLFDFFGIHWEPGWLSSIGTATIGAVIVLWIWNKLKK
jgi:uncharacterized membrane protein YeaQ/YmgE (transglycosylase-associated protein family)